MLITQNSPYRILGIYSNSPTKERVANRNRLKAFLNVGKEISFPLDLPVLLPTIARSAETISEADAKLTLPREQLRYAQFWFMKATALDDIAMNHLIKGNVGEAMSIWEKKDTASSLQNRIVCALIQGDYTTAFVCAEKLYSRYVREFVSTILGECNTVNIEQLAHQFLDELCAAIGSKIFLPYLQNSNWKQYVCRKTIKPLIETLQSAIDAAKSSKGAGSMARYNAGVKLMNETREVLAQLKTLLSPTDLQYRVPADKLGLEILQCGIDYYNGSKAADAACKAIKLAAYAQSVVVGKSAKERCRENVTILQKIIDDLPPAEVFSEDTAIRVELRKFYQMPEKISHAVALLNKTKPHIQSIKAKLGVNSPFYLKLSTQIVGNALYNVIKEVNSGQQTYAYGLPINSVGDIQVISALRRAWSAIKIMDTFDMESDFKVGRYTQNRSILKKMCEHLGISTTAYAPRSSASQSRKTSIVVGVGYAAVGAVIGGLVAGVCGAVLGAVVGLTIFAMIYKMIAE